MKISEAKNIYASQLDALRGRKQELSKMIEEKSGAGAPRRDRIELSQELSEVEKQYNQISKTMEQLSQRETIIHNAEVSKQQGEAMEEAMNQMIKCMEIARRISEGAKVPAADEKMLMEYSHELYMASKNMAVLNANKKHKEYDSLVEEEEEAQGPEKSASEVAADAEVDIQLPEVAPEMPAASE